MCGGEATEQPDSKHQEKTKNSNRTNTGKDDRGVCVWGGGSNRKTWIT